MKMEKTTKWSNHNFALEPITYETVRRLKGIAKYDCIKAREQWLDKEREQEQREVNRINSKIYHHKNREKLNEYARQHYQKNKEKIQENQRKRYQIMKNKMGENKT